MLSNPLRIVVSLWQIRLKVFFDVVLHAQPLARLYDAMSVLFPVSGIRHRQVVSPPDFIQIDKLMSRLDDCQTAIRVQRRLQTNPGEYPGVVKSLQRLNPIAWQLRPALPLQRERIIQRGEGAGECVPVGPEQVNVTKRPRPAFGQGANTQPVPLEYSDRIAGQGVVTGEIWVSGERHHDLFGDASRFVLLRVLFERLQIIFAFNRSGIKLLSRHFQNARHIAVRALMAASPVWVSRQRAVLSSLTSRGIYDRTPLDAHAVRVECWPFIRSLFPFQIVKQHISKHGYLLKKVLAHRSSAVVEAAPFPRANMIKQKCAYSVYGFDVNSILPNSSIARFFKNLQEFMLGSEPAEL